jgi:hypothetical protein
LQEGPTKRYAGLARNRFGHKSHRQSLPFMLQFSFKLFSVMEVVRLSFCLVL